MLIGDTILQESDVKVLTDEELEFVVYDTGKYASLEDPSWKICIFDEEKVSFPCAVKDLPMEKYCRTFSFYRELTDEEYETVCQNIDKDELCGTSLTKKKNCKNNYWSCELHPRTIPKIEICCCSGCRTVDLEGEEYNKRQIKNHHCVYCSCNLCVCDARREIGKHENKVILPHWDNA